MGRVRYIPNQRALDDYYLHQTGGGDFYFKRPSHQRGHGLGGLFGRLFRAAVPVFKTTVAPVLKSAGKSIAREALKSGTDMAADVLKGESVKDSFGRHANSAAGRLVELGSKRLHTMLDSPQPIRKGRLGTPARKRRRKTIKGDRDIYS